MDRIGTNTSLQEGLVEGFEAMGCSPERARAMVEAGFLAHNSIERYRTASIGAVGDTYPDLMEDGAIDSNLMLLIIQLEMAHLHQVFHFLKEQLGMTDDAGGETIQ